MNTRMPKSIALRECIREAWCSGPFRSKKQVVVAIFKKWRAADKDENSDWRHGSGKKSNLQSPDPDQPNPSSTWSKYEEGTSPQNYQGWCMVAEVLGVDVEQIIEPAKEPKLDVPTDVFQTMPGDVPLHRLANLEVSSPTPLKGRNTINTEAGVRQPLAMSIKPIFGTLRNEGLYDQNDNLLATANIEAIYAHVIVETEDKNMDVLDGIGFNGEQVLADVLKCRYVGESNGRLYFEVSAARTSKTLAGISPALPNFVALEGVFNKEDWMGIGIEKGGLQILEFSKDGDAPTSDLNLRDQIKRHVLSRGIDLGNSDGSNHNIHLTARRFFMKRSLESEQTKEGPNDAGNK